MPQKEPKLKDLDVDSVLGYASSTTMARGLRYFEQNRAQVISADDLRAVVLVQGSGWKPYTVRIRLDNKRPGELVHAVCDCPHANGQPYVFCKHKACALLALREHFEGNTTPRNWNSVLDEIMPKRPKAKKITAKSLLYFVISRAYYEQQITPYILPMDNFGPDAPEDKNALAEIIMARKLHKFGVPVPYSKALENVVGTISGIAAAKLIGMSMRFYNFDVPSDALLPMIGDDIIFIADSNGRNLSKVTIALHPAQIELNIAREDGNLRLTPCAIIEGERVPLNGSEAQIVFEKPMWVISNGLLFAVKGNRGFVAGLLESNGIEVPVADQQEFFENYLPSLADELSISGDVSAQSRDLLAEPVPRVYLSESDGELAAELRFGYDEHEVRFEKALPPHSVKWDAGTGELVRIHRNSETEEQAWKNLSSFGLKRLAGETLGLRQNVHAVDFLLRHLPKIAEAGYEIYGEEDIKSVRVNRSKPRISLSISSGIDWFEVKTVVNFDDQEVPFAQLRRALKKQEKYVKLSDGSIGEIPEDWLRRYRGLFEAAEEADGALRLTKSQIMLLDAAMEEADTSQADEEFRHKRDRLKDFSRIEHRDLPSGLTGELRNYQKAGYDWLHFLHEYEFGGCLADDMGIGKTIQALTFLQSLQESGHAQSADLVVVPRSLLGNWEREAAKFTPGLRVLIHADQDRTEEVEEFSNFDLILTTYGVMLRDIDALINYNFHYVILDESQAVKNPLSLTAKAARRLKSDHRLVLTGTPVENSTIELWSQFAFINPGMLGSMDHFKNEFVSAIERQGDADMANSLRGMVHPFILRRTKEQVAPELPPRTERIIYCEMNPAQQKLYERTREQYRAMLLGMMEDSGMRNARMKVLEGLLRLRQICNHPKLVEETYPEDSAKLEVLMEMLETLQAEGHKALVFSQFTKMLKIIRSEMSSRKYPHLYLDGHTRNRQERVDEFQQDPNIPFFLISLKAGGVGLNLTAADYVIHVDPWWNPAVERQASDRTHRIGQENPVFINKLIVRGTVEEKMLELQDKKRELVEQLVSTESSFFKSLTVDDVRQLFS